MKKLFIAITGLLLLASCTDATQAKFGAYGDQFEISIVNCDGSVTNKWTSTGKVGNNSKSDGYYFNDSKTGTLIEVSGNVIVKRINK